MRTVKRICSIVLLAGMLICSLCSCGIFSDMANKNQNTDGSSDGAELSELDRVSTKTAPAPVIPSYSGKNTLTAAITEEIGVPSPFFFKTENERLGADLSFVKLMNLDRGGSPVTDGVSGQKTSYLGEEYTYYGISAVEVTKNADGTADYDFTLREDVFFSDGTNLTADDVIFSMYVLLDPSYSGYCELSSLPIVGLESYRRGMVCLGDVIYDTLGSNEVSDGFSDTDKERFLDRMNTAEQIYVSEFLRYMKDNTEESVLTANAGKWADVASDEKYLTAITMVMYGYAVWEKTNGGELTGALITADGNNYDCVRSFPSHQDLFSCIAEETESLLDIDGKHFEAVLDDALREAFGSSYEYYFELKHQKSSSASSILGIVKTGMYGLRVRLERYDVSDVYGFSFYVAPLHAYGSREEYKYTQDKFGFPKGDLRQIKNRKTQVSSGAYFYKGNVDGAYRFERNKLYYLGCPYISYVDLVCAQPNEDLVGAIADGKYDVAAHKLDSALISRVNEANRDGAFVTLEKYSNAEYAYIGLNCDLLRVGEEPSSGKSIALRTAFCVLFSYYAESAYAGEISEVTYSVSGPAQLAWSVDGVDEIYKKNLFGEDICSPEMNENEKSDSLRSALLGYLVTAGYTLNKEETKIEAAPDGGSLEFSFVMLRDDAYSEYVERVVNGARDMLGEIGITLTAEYADSDKEMQTMIGRGVVMWAYTRALTPEPEFADFFYSKNSPKHSDGTGENYSRISDKELDALLIEMSTADDREERLRLCREALGAVYANGAEIPLFVGYGALLRSADGFDQGAEPCDTTVYYTWADTVHTLRMS